MIYLDAFLASSVGKASLAFLRVAAATLLACWVNAGLPVQDLTSSLVLGWVELSIQAGAALVIANFLGPWETRYGRNKRQV